MNTIDKGSPENLGALDARRAIDAGTLTASALLEACIGRIRAREPDVRAWTHIDEAGARKTAAALDAGPSRGLLHGLPFGMKDIIDSFDQPTTYGSRIYADNRPVWDGATTAMPRAAGAVLLGKTVTTEFANRHPGPTMNPHNKEHTPGGSSSGSAAAVGDRQVPFAVGTQTGGSVIRPSAYCGAYGYKPTLQHFGNAGVRTNTEAYDTVGLMSRALEDLPLLRAAMMGIDYRAPDQSDVSRPRIARCRTHHWDRALPETHAALEETRRVLEAAGAEVFDLDLPDFFSGLHAAHRTVCGFESIRNYSDELARYPDLVSQDFLKERVEVGEATSLAEYRAALQLGTRARRWIDAAMVEQRIDAILTPSAEGEAPKGLAFTGSPIFNFTWTHLYMPCLTMPHFSGPNGLPVGVQLVGRRHEDDRLFDIAMWADHIIAAR